MLLVTDIHIVFFPYDKLCTTATSFRYLVGIIAAYWLRRFADAAVEITLMIMGVYATFFFAEHVCGVSGVLAVVVMGVVLAKQREWSISRHVIHENHVVWSELGFIANTIIFTVGGIIIYHQMMSCGVAQPAADSTGGHRRRALFTETVKDTFSGLADKLTLTDQDLASLGLGERAAAGAAVGRRSVRGLTKTPHTNASSLNGTTTTASCHIDTAGEIPWLLLMYVWASTAR